MRTRTKQFATAVILLTSLLLSTITVAAQTGISDWSRLTTVATGSKLSVKLRNGNTMEGTLTGVSDTALTLMVKNTAKEARRHDVLTVHNVTRKSAAKATLIGLGAGAGAGAIFGAAADSRSDSFETLDNIATAVTTVIGAGAGALGGFLVGRTGKKRVLIYEAK
jgi:small nuclear ribonucleoprotein (snRNP)-like protein